MQVVGECARESDLEVNPVREKKLTNIRTVNADEKVSFSGPSCPHTMEACSKFCTSEACTDACKPLGPCASAVG